MATASAGTSSTSSLLKSSSSEEDLQQIMDQRKRKRMLSNRESARRSRMRKQKHLDDLTAQVSQLTRESHQIVTSINLTSQLYSNLEAENSILRAQMAELNNRLQSLNEIIQFMNTNNGAFESGPSGDASYVYEDCFSEPWSSSFYASQPCTMSSAEFVI